MFNFLSKSFIGVDIASSSIKICELISKGRGIFEIKKFGYIPLPEGVLLDGEILKSEVVIQSLKDVFRNSKIKSKNICTCVTGNQTVIRRMSAPDGKVE